MKTDYIIIGQGLCGTLLSYELLKRGKSVVVVDDGNPSGSSRVAAGFINPVTGKRHVTSWRFDTFIHTALEVYEALEKETGLEIIRKISLIQFHTGREEREVFTNRMKGNPWLSDIDADVWDVFFNFHFGAGSAAPCYIIHPHFLNVWRNKLSFSGMLREQQFNWDECEINSDGVHWNDIQANAVICCDGSASFRNPYFQHLPFSLNKGQVLHVRIPGLPNDCAYHHRYKLIPLQNELFWVGASFEWNYPDLNIISEFRLGVETYLRDFLKLPSETIAHIAGERPSSIDYRPFVGRHPNVAQVAILNGMGTKGYLQAPFFAIQLAEYLCEGSTLSPEVDIQRFARLLTKFGNP